MGRSVRGKIPVRRGWYDVPVTDTTLDQLVSLSHELGREERHLTILGEGNTSALADAQRGAFWVKGSGSSLGTIKPEQFSLADTRRVLDVLDGPALGDAELDAAMRGALLDKSHAKPSIETLLHATCLTEGGAKFVGHTHAEACNGILCSRHGAEPFERGHVFPDAIVVCGRHPLVVPYTDPGLPIAMAFRDALRRYVAEHGVTPKLALLVNHGIVALGQTAREVVNITLMAEKWARILSASLTLGGPQYLPDASADRIDNRPDEHHRRRMLSAQA
jgi:rhamnose utilization protein RhaD (predicted bifunctional aldolase and dehydrogenase)